MVVFVGPNSEPITGQSLAFHTIFSKYNGDKKAFYFDTLSVGKLKQTISNLFNFFYYLLLLVKKNEVSVVYITTSRTLVGFLRDSAFILTAKLFKKNVVNHLHGADFKSFHSRQSNLVKMCVDYVYNMIDTSIVLLPRMREQYDMYPEMNIVSVSNCTSPIKSSLSYSKRSNKILYLSNIMYSKGIMQLISAVDDLVNDGWNIELNIAGLPTGDNYKDKEEISGLFNSAINGKDYINYVGVVRGSDKNNMFSNNGIFVLPSFYATEAQPISLIEAMSAGCVIITTKHNYLSDIVTNKNGFLIKKESSEAIKECLLYLLNNQDVGDEISQYNSLVTDSLYSVENYVDAISSVFNQFKK
ncbi:MULTISPECIES: glycosyltransferase family 4 protein [Vibrio harveyi group]|uniref:glycosyltransferase family 4 protein n=1 Tax=Vibrio harveyi group TaxID=717610 RepID=UPI00375095FB